MIVGVGVDLVDVARFTRALKRTPKLRERLFAESERDLPVRSLAARFAAKEALIKAVGHSTEFRWHDMAVVSDEHRNPGFAVSGGVAAALAEIGATRVHLSMSHDGGNAMAFVVAEGDAR
ncbi:holo-ACP synthase [Herbiconiux moechotypicola]|uniref:Holo-[acyl-carrier-protein] synthase n=1 Tax=Herbiconiux moechotypicola TaxID=637393 RepID=A0ABP5QSF3_9MICO|nr:holo-ACP synthase [Herbiconiux moechotypicola]MCS5730571.1 holo-ACP synthase [Herbiconiux moechotypicola]